MYLGASLQHAQRQKRLRRLVKIYCENRQGLTDSEVSAATGIPRSSVRVLRGALSGIVATRRGAYTMMPPEDLYQASLAVVRRYRYEKHRRDGKA